MGIKFFSANSEDEKGRGPTPYSGNRNEEPSYGPGIREGNVGTLPNPDPENYEIVILLMGY